MKNLLFTIIFLISTFSIQAQCSINYDSSYQFIADLPALTTLPGSAIPAYYSYFWEFGDGTYSRNQDPVHHFASTPTHEVLLHNGGNYSNGGEPGTKKDNRCTLIPNDSTSQAENYDIITSGSLGMELGLNSGHNIVISETTAPLMLAYKNTTSTTISGNLYLYYNNTENVAFEIENSPRVHHGETSTELIPSNETFQNSLGWSFENLEADEERRIFIDLLTLDTSQAIHTIQLLFSPNNGVNGQTLDFELETARAYDPNKIVGRKKENCSCRTQRYDYKVHFQNDGKGAANTIKIKAKDLDGNWDIESFVFKRAQIFTTEIPMENIDFATDEIAGIVTITLSQVFLAGKNDARKKKEQKGFVEFSISPKEHWKGSKSEAAIIFDTNEAVVTPRKARILPSICTSFGLKGGLNDIYNLNNKVLTTNNFFIGGQLAWRTKRNYFYQTEILFAQGNLSPLIDTITSNFIAINRLDSVTQNIRTLTNSYRRIDFVPIHVGQRFRDKLNIGIGYQLSYFLKNDINSQQTLNTFYQNENYMMEAIATLETQPKSIERDFSKFESQFFADLNYTYKSMGLGFRYYYGITGERFQARTFDQRSNLQLYALLQF